MNTSEFSAAFSTLLNSYNTPAEFGEQASKREIVLDEYEKSLFLTKAQEELVLSLYTGRNSSGNSFDETEELRRNLANLIAEAELTPITNSSGKPIGMEGKNSYFFSLPDGTGTEAPLWFITYESVDVNYGEDSKCGSTGSLEVTPVRQDEYHKIKRNPFRGANNRRALRLDLGDNNVEIVCNYPISKYYIRYIIKPTPIVLEDLPDGLTVNGETKETQCILDSSVHQRILEIAVAMAYRSKVGNTNTK